MNDKETNPRQDKGKEKKPSKWRKIFNKLNLSIHNKKTVDNNELLTHKHETNLHEDFYAGSISQVDEASNYYLNTESNGSNSESIDSYNSEDTLNEYDSESIDSYNSEDIGEYAQRAVYEIFIGNSDYKKQPNPLVKKRRTLITNRTNSINSNHNSESEDEYWWSFTTNRKAISGYNNKNQMPEAIYNKLHSESNYNNYEYEREVLFLRNKSDRFITYLNNRRPEDIHDEHRAKASYDNFINNKYKYEKEALLLINKSNRSITDLNNSVNSNNNLGYIRNRSTRDWDSLNHKKPTNKESTMNRRDNDKSLTHKQETNIYEKDKVIKETQDRIQVPYEDNIYNLTDFTIYDKEGSYKGFMSPEKLYIVLSKHLSTSNYKKYIDFLIKHEAADKERQKPRISFSGPNNSGDIKAIIKLTGYGEEEEITSIKLENEHGSASKENYVYKYSIAIPQWEAYKIVKEAADHLNEDDPSIWKFWLKVMPDIQKDYDAKCIDILPM